MATQTLLRLGLPSGFRLFPNQFRELIARDCDLPPDFFNHDEAGGTVSLPPTILMLGGRTWVGVLAQPEAAEALMGAMGQILQATSRAVGSPVKVSVEEHDLAIKPTHHPVEYWLRECALRKRTKAAKAMTNEELVKSRLETGLARYAATFGLDCPTIEHMDIQVSVLGSKGLRLNTSRGLTNDYVSLIDARFTAFVDLSGLWSVGCLTSRGYGRIGRDLGALSQVYQGRQAVGAEKRA